MVHYERTKMPAKWAARSGGEAVPRGLDYRPEPAEGNWRTRAVCREEDPELFFPTGSTGPAAAQIEEAKAVCHRCPVMWECGKWAYETGQQDGVWGGRSEEERRAMKRRADRQALARSRSAASQAGGKEAAA